MVVGGYGWIWMDMDGYGWMWMDMHWADLQNCALEQRREALFSRIMEPRHEKSKKIMSRTSCFKCEVFMCGPGGAENEKDTPQIHLRLSIDFR